MSPLIIMETLQATTITTTHNSDTLKDLVYSIIAILIDLDHSAGKMNFSEPTTYNRKYSVKISTTPFTKYQISIDTLK